MNLKEFTILYGDILNVTPTTVLTAETQAIINKMLKYQFGLKYMLYETEAEVADVVDFTLYDNSYKHKALYDILNYAMPLYTNLLSKTYEKENTGTQNITDTTTKTSTVTNDLTVSETVKNTGSVVNAATGTDTTVNSEDIDPITNTKRVKPFDSAVVVDSEETETSAVIKVVEDVLTKATTDTRTDDLTSTTTRTDATVNELIESDSVVSNRVDDLLESVTESETDTNVMVKLEQLGKMVETTQRTLCSEICKDLVNNLCERTWE